MSDKSLKIGLLGGSFNPAHEGHVHVSLQAIEKLELDEVWWMVSPQNPLKPIVGMGEFSERMQTAEAITKDQPKIHVRDDEKKNDTNRTLDLIYFLQKEYPEHHFVWLMGADSMIEMHQWYGWEEIMNRLPIAVFDRGDYAPHALTSVAATKFEEAMVNEDQLSDLPLLSTPVWGFFATPKHPASATEIREKNN